MIEIDKLVSAICSKIPEGSSFEPAETNLNNYFPAAPKEEQEEISPIDFNELEKQVPMAISPRYPIENQVVAIDTTNFTLGQIPDGLVGVVRASVITKAPNKTSHSLEKYGPYLVGVTNQNKDQMYKRIFKAIYGVDTEANSPDTYKILDRIRSLLERYIQIDVAKNCKNSIILLDGSLIGGTVGDPTFVLKGILDDATSNGNSIVAISKSTGLTLQRTQKNILSLLDGIQGPCYIGKIKEHINQKSYRYFGEVYVAKLTPLGEPFRIDIPQDAPLSHDEIFARLAGLAGDYGYPEELKLAHMTCVLSSIEIIELQSAAIMLHGLSMKEELRPKIFPL
jgi:hypothetical protein